MSAGNEFLKNCKVPHHVTPEKFDIEKYMESDSNGRKDAERFSAIRPGVLNGTNIKYRGKDNAKDD